MGANRVAVLIALAVLTSACAPKYTVTASGPTAKLRYLTNTGDVTQLLRYDTTQCPGVPQQQRVATTAESVLIPGEVSQLQMIGTSGGADSKVRELLIDAGQPFVFKVHSSGTSADYIRKYTCTVRGGFVPKAGLEYEMSFQNGNSGCRNRIFRLSKGSNGQIVRTPDPTQRYLRVIDDQEMCQWRPVRSDMPDEIRAALEGGTGSGTQSDSAAGSAPDAKTPAAPEEPGSELREALKAAPPPPPPPPKAEPDVATAAPAAAATNSNATAAKTNPAIPRAGDRWTYSMTSSGRVIGRVTVEAAEVRGNRVSERITRGGYPSFVGEREVVTGVHPSRVITTELPGGYTFADIAPYLAGEELKIGDSWSALQGSFFIPHLRRDRLMNARVAARETVMTTAGEFDAWRIEAVSEIGGVSGEGKVSCTWWLSPSMKRVVKVRVKIESPYAGGSSEDVYDLVTFEPAH